MRIFRPSAALRLCALAPAFSRSASHQYFGKTASERRLSPMREWACLAMMVLIGLTACVHHDVHRSEQASVPSVPPPPPDAVTELPPAPSTVPPTASATPPPVPAQSQPITPANPKVPAAPGKPAPATADAKPSAANPAKEKTAPAGAPIAPAPVTAGVPGSAPSPSPAPSTPKPQLDFKAMEQRLRNTSAIGVFTKLSIKNQVDDLLKAFRGYHAGRTPPTLDDLHQRYDGLLLKVVSLVQNDDPNLAASISASRSAIWERLSNRESFQAI
jgi:hypothetical protein